MEQPRTTIRQAVVIIHGIGEQRPMDTLRGFVDSVLPDPPDESQLKFWAKPDRMSESFELRRFSARPLEGRPRTDFYEYYWAFHMRDTRLRHVLIWLLRLLLRNPARVPSRILPVWVTAWALLLLIGGLALASGMLGGGGFALLSRYTANLSWLFGLLFSLFSTFLVNSLGDAARYMTPTPENVAQRQRIRADGVRLLRHLHTSGKYDRIIVVGHSLGSVIAYDIITHLWTEYNKMHGRPDDFSQPYLKQLNAAIARLGDHPTPEQVEAFQDFQHRLWLEQRKMGNPWLVSDLITLGSPLTSAAFLLTQSEEELRARQRELAFPTCPPQPDPIDNQSYSFILVPYYRNSAGELRAVRVLHHAAQFACTRWTNFYYPGDFIGGPLAPVFGPGVRDVSLQLGGWKLRSYLPTTHTRYWRKRGVPRGKPFPEKESIDRIVEAADLRCTRWLGMVKDVPDAGLTAQSAVQEPPTGLAD
ncbi:MAG: hypothetical protein D6803_07305 [Anaerolineae bacterium]|nr:MAG: hypothetical protein D6803_07305 [Anaerolineae bacterium]